MVSKMVDVNSDAGQEAEGEDDEVLPGHVPLQSLAVAHHQEAGTGGESLQKTLERTTRTRSKSAA